MKKIMMIAGARGVGKTSFLGIIRGISEYVPDMIDETETDGSEGEKERRYQEMIALIEDCMQWDLPVLLETTLFPGLIPSLAKAKEQGYRIELDYIAVSSLEDSMERIQKRGNRGGRFVPMEQVKTCFENRWERLLAILPLCDKVVFYDNDNGFRAVGIYSEKGVVPKCKILPPWWYEMVSYFEDRKKRKWNRNDSLEET